MMLARVLRIWLVLALGAGAILIPAADAAPLALSVSPGDLDTTFDSDGILTTDVGGDDIAQDVVVQEDGRIVVAGHAIGPSGFAEFAIARYNLDGSLDLSFGGDGMITTSVASLNDYARAVTVQPDGRILAAGYATSASQFTDDVAIVRYEADGSLDQTFAVGGVFLSGIGNFNNDRANTITLQGDGKIIVAGSVRGTYEDILVMRINANGSADTSFGPKGARMTEVDEFDDAAHAVAIDTDSRIVVSGETNPSTSSSDVVVLRYQSNGDLDPSFDGDGIAITALSSFYDMAKDMEILPDGRILVGGHVDLGAASYDIALVQYLPDGALDPSFGTAGVVQTDLGSDSDYGEAVALQEDGKLIVGGYFLGEDSLEFMIARFLANGDLDPTFGGGDGWSSNTIANTSYAFGAVLQSDGNVVLAGSARPNGFDEDFALARYIGGDFQPSGLGGDFNGDGLSDLAVGVPWEDTGSVEDPGAMNVLYATDAGLASTGNQFWDQSNSGTGTNQLFDGFGFASTSGDFNGDGFADLAAGVPGKTVGGDDYAGSVSVIYGGSAGLSSSGSQQWTQDSTDINDTAEASDFFGWSVASGDLNGDGFDDLAVGVPSEGVSGKADAGAVNVIYGSASGLVAAGDQFWHQDSTNINNTPEKTDQFGLSVGTGDFDGDGFVDLAIGIPTENVDTESNGGAVSVIYGSASGLTSTADDFWHQDSTDINNTVEADDWFGYRVAGGDFDGDGFADLLIGVPEENLTGGANAGGVSVIYGTSTGLSAAGDDFWNQDSSGINEDVDPDDEFGLALAAGDFDGDGFDDAAIGVPAEDISGEQDAGAVSVIYGTSGGLDDPNDNLWHQDREGIEDSAFFLDLFGYAVMAGNFGNGPEDDLAVGVPLEIIGGVDSAGAVNVIYGSPSDLTEVGDQFWNQDSTGIVDQAEFDDEFGFGLAQPSGGAGPAIRSRSDRLVATPMVR